MTLKTILSTLWTGLRKVSGDDAYERYLEHWRSSHSADAQPPLDRQAFFKSEQERKWNGIKRCC